MNHHQPLILGCGLGLGNEPRMAGMNTDVFRLGYGFGRGPLKTLKYTDLGLGFEFSKSEFPSCRISENQCVQWLTSEKYEPNLAQMNPDIFRHGAGIKKKTTDD
ncbi:MAG: hypothetical protein JJU29_15550 [Verrucomicrobia bacterium]|nr:hypothetical protein [Verrucomicrobiota bacterium]MCH8513381.1 hypothetical protein [Kiritimatiellia bacterium]